MFEELDERDLDLDTEDAALEDENSEDVEDTEDEKDATDEDDESDDADADKKDSDEDLDKPLTKRDLNKILESNQNKKNAQRRVSSQKGRDINQPPKTNDRLDRVERTLQHTALLERKRDFGYKNNLSPDEVDVVFRLTQRPTSKFLKEPHVKGAIEGLRAHRNVRNNTPGSTGQSFKAAGGKEWKDLNDAEKQANFADRRRAILESKRK